uniref:hypothetical protein n=1 Tax=Enterococcus faecalis TaxID=1351 RepID=UPI00155DD984|nr:hypothetical protein [Enterococcus faecalis]
MIIPEYVTEKGVNKEEGKEYRKPIIFRFSMLIMIYLRSRKVKVVAVIQLEMG